MRRRDGVGHSSLPSSPTSFQRRNSISNQNLQDESNQHQDQQSEKENRNDSQELEKYCNDYTISQNHNIKPQKKVKNLSQLKTHRYPSPSAIGGNGHNSSVSYNQQVSTPINMNRIAGTSFFDSRNHRMELNNAYKLIDILKRENNQIKSKQNQDTFLIDQVGNLKTDILMKQKEIEQLKIENKTLKKIKRKQESALGNHSEENKINLKIQQYQNQILELTSALKNEKSKNLQIERNAKKQHAFMTDIYNEYRFICQQQNLQPKIKFEKYNQMIENNSICNNDQNDVDQEDELSQQQNSQRLFPDSITSLQHQKQISDIISMPFTQQNFMKLKEMALQYIKQLEEIDQQQKRENQRQQKMIMQQQQEQQKMDNFILQQSLNKQKIIENNRYENHSSDDSQQSQRISNNISSSKHSQQQQQKETHSYNHIPSSSRQSNRVNRKSIEIISEEDFESSQKGLDSNKKKTYSPDDIAKKIESDHCNRITNFRKQEIIGFQSDDYQTNEEKAKANKKQNNQNKLNPLFTNEYVEDSDQNDEAVSLQASMGSQLIVCLKEAFVGQSYLDIDSRDFNDRAILKRKYNLKIVSITVYLNKELRIINGLRCEYAESEDIFTKEQKIVKGKDNVFGSDSSSKVKVKMDKDDYLQNISVIYDIKEKLIRQITFISAKNQIYVTGEVDQSQKDKQYEKQQLNISQQEYPVCVFGTLKPYSKQGEKKHSDCVSCICYLGFQLALENEDLEDDAQQGNQMNKKDLKQKK
ncbi:hypothetical protein TTHERM_00726200 (macronuclear) [Tetrahymena thermophila SB210]|uniref:Uncharacterized protein n=1 Tax=Tetrahymena thermophila (strain SB210) TaxID=312017 RepID=Q24GH1_TETTS|nr:hypothetical protein TTHERM_00726200 [Tetrahymena thermophila SB210]EAS06900.2 hypothetical protein TTHERM_00726200 [Tetrahymena thermophila SB210]|eukprot:XP_001027142.2 hypothetical protein TTHERM_00726200 [Tetrahymena thermophila SB210]